MAIWRKHRLLSLDEQDKQDKVMAGSEFLVEYIGSTSGYENSGKTEKALEEFLKNLVCTFKLRKSSVFRLYIDLSGAALYDNEGRALGRFQLCNIRDVIYCDNIQEYLKYFVLVGREASDLNIKAHVLICESKEKARCLYETFIETFELGVVVAGRKQRSDKALYKESDRVTFPSYPESAETGKPQETRGNSFEDSQQQIRWNSPNTFHGPKARQLKFQKNSDFDSDDGFTELARSRSTSSDGSSSLLSTQNGSSFLHITSSQDSVFW